MDVPEEAVSVLNDEFKRYGISLDESQLEYVTALLCDEDIRDTRDDILSTCTEIIEDSGVPEEDCLNIMERCLEQLVQYGYSPDTLEMDAKDLERTTFKPINLYDIVLEEDEFLKESSGGQLPALEVTLRAATVNADKVQKQRENDARKLLKREEKEAMKMRKINQVAHATNISKAADDLGEQSAATFERPEEGAKRTATEVYCEDIDVSVGAKVLIRSATFRLVKSRRYGLIGRNGCGKTTLMRKIAQRAFKGVPTTLSILHVEQESVGSEHTAVQEVLMCDAERESLLKEEAELVKSEGDVERLNQIYIRLQTIGAFDAEARARRILQGLGFDVDMQQQATNTFSGGWRMRISLAKALFSEPDLLLLDEPTNHLDLEAVLWLERYLASWPSTILVVSHQRTFLNAVCTDIIHIQGCEMSTYRGDYNRFEEVMTQQRKLQRRHREAQQRHQQHMQAFIDRFRFNANRAKLVQSRVKAMQKMTVVADVIDDPTIRFVFPEVEEVPSPLIKLTDVSFAYNKDSTNVLNNVNRSVHLDSRIALIGVNGSGKSTLIKLMCGFLEPTTGTVEISRKMRSSFFAQHHVDSLDLSMNAIQHIQSLATSEMKSEEARRHLGKFGIIGEMALRPMQVLSGGQKSRVNFAANAFKKAHLYAFDEPTNHLDMESIDALAMGLANYNGAVVLVTHDERLLELISGEIWLIENGTVTTLDSFAQYKKRIQEQM